MERCNRNIEGFEMCFVRLVAEITLGYVKEGRY
jgi:hypothetical protein